MVRKKLELEQIRSNSEFEKMKGRAVQVAERILSVHVEADAVVT